MIILNQDKDEIINFENIMCINITDCQENGYSIFAGFDIEKDDCYRILGVYGKKERAEKILQEIISTYKINKCIENGLDIKNVISEEILEELSKNDYLYQYSMPEK